MPGIPANLLRHNITIRPYEGSGPSGPLYGAPVQVRCFIEDKRTLVRVSSATSVLASATVYCPLETVAPPESEVTYTATVPVPYERTTTVITAARRDGGGLPTPDHLELALR